VMKKEERSRKDSSRQRLQKGVPGMSEDHHAEQQEAEPGGDVAQPIEGLHPCNPEILSGFFVHRQREPSIRTLSGQPQVLRSAVVARRSRVLALQRRQPRPSPYNTPS